MTDCDECDRGSCWGCPCWVETIPPDVPGKPPVIEGGTPIAPAKPLYFILFNKEYKQHLTKSILKILGIRKSLGEKFKKYHIQLEIMGQGKGHYFLSKISSYFVTFFIRIIEKYENIKWNRKNLKNM